MDNKPTLIIGASTNPERYSYLAIKKLLQYHHTVKAIGVKSGLVNNIPIETSLIPFENIHTVTLYINPTLQKEYYNYIFSLHPKRIIFNPGTENDELVRLSQKNGIDCINGCTLTMLASHLY